MHDVKLKKKIGYKASMSPELTIPILNHTIVRIKTRKVFDL